MLECAVCVMKWLISSLLLAWYIPNPPGGKTNKSNWKWNQVDPKRSQWVSSKKLYIIPTWFPPEEAFHTEKMFHLILNQGVSWGWINKKVWMNDYCYNDKKLLVIWLFNIPTYFKSHSFFVERPVMILFRGTLSNMPF